MSIGQILAPGWRDVAGGTLLAAVGIFAGLRALTQMHVGTPGNMGPGFFPLLLGAALMLCGLGMIAATLIGPVMRRIGARSLSPPTRTDEIQVNWRAIGLVSLSVALFAVTLRPLGMVPASFLLVFVAGLADPTTAKSRLAALALGLSLASWVIFILALGMPLRAFAI